MCGLVGMLTNNTIGFFNKDRDLFKEMLIVNSLRGAHSTGVFGGKIDGATDFAKAVGNPYDFINHPETAPLFNKMVAKWRFMVGHGRHATRGTINGINAHPFKIDHITMSHNGTVYGSDLIKIEKDTVDSKAVCEALTKYDPVEVFQDIDGAFAIIYHNEKTKSLNFVRNKERPLTIGFDVESKRMLFASEKNMLILTAARNGIKLTDVISIPEDVIFTFEQGSLDYKETKVPQKVKIYPVNTPIKNYNNYNKTHSPIEGKITKITSRSTGVVLSLGDKVRFHIKEIMELNAKQNVYQVFGSVVDYPEIEIAAIWKEKEEVLYNKQEWEGTVKSISSTSSRQKLQGLLHCIYVGDIHSTTTVTTLDGSEIDKEEFKHLAANGCDYCKGEIGEEDAELCLVDSTYIFCKECSSTFTAKQIAV